MGAPYQSQSASGYNSSPPPDDGSTVAANKITWATIKSKLPDPIKTLADAINSALRTALNITPSTTSVNYTSVVGDHLTTIELASGATLSLGDAATMIAQTMGYKVTAYNKSTASSSTVNLVTAGNTLAGQANGTVTLPPGAAMTFTVNQAGTGYDILSATGFAPFVLTGASGTNTITANAPSNLIGLYSGLTVLLTPAASNTGATTINITPSGGSALTAKNVFVNGAACVGGELQISVPVVCVYDGTQFNAITPIRSQANAWTASATVSNAASLNLFWTAAQASAVDIIEIFIAGITTASNNQPILARFSTDGSTFDTGSNYQWTGQNQLANPASTTNRGSGAAVTVIQISDTINNAVATSSGMGYGVIANPSSTTFYKLFSGKFTCIPSSGGVDDTVFSGLYISTTALRGIQILANSGNISGTAYAVGRSKS